MLALRSNGYWLHGIAAVGDKAYSTVWGPTGGGLQTASWAMALPRGFTHPALRQGAYVELCESGVPIGSGIMAEPDRDNWTFLIDGLYRQAEKFQALDDDLVPTTMPNRAVHEAQDRGLPWIDPGAGVTATLPNDVLSPPSEERANFNTVAQVLNMQSETTGQRWWVSPYGKVLFYDDPTEISWHLTPGVPAMATADADYVSTQFVRYISSMSGTPLEADAWAVESATDPAAAARWGVREVGEDLTNLGLVAGGFAGDAAAALLADGRARPAFTEAVEVTPYQITTPGGTSAHPHLVRAGQRVKHMGVLASDGSVSLSGVEWVIGGTSWAESEPRKLLLSPVGLAARTPGAVIDRLVKKAQKKFA